MILDKQEDTILIAACGLEISLISPNQIFFKRFSFSFPNFKPTRNRHTSDINELNPHPLSKSCFFSFFVLYVTTIGFALSRLKSLTWISWIPPMLRQSLMAADIKNIDCEISLSTISHLINSIVLINFDSVNKFKKDPMKSHSRSPSRSG